MRERLGFAGEVCLRGDTYHRGEGLVDVFLFLEERSSAGLGDGVVLCMSLPSKTATVHHR